MPSWQSKPWRVTATVRVGLGADVPRDSDGAGDSDGDSVVLVMVTGAPKVPGVEVRVSGDQLYVRGLDGRSSWAAAVGHRVLNLLMAGPSRPGAALFGAFSARNGRWRQAGEWYAGKV